MSTLKIILGSTRPGSIAPAIGDWVAGQARRLADFDEVVILDLAEINLPFLDEPHHPKLGRYTKPHTLAWANDIDTADALVIITPEYNGGYPAPLKNALDFLHAEWSNKALGMVSYGGGLSGGARAADMLLPVTSQLGLACARHTVAIPRANRQVVDGEFVPTPADSGRITAMLAELARLDAHLAPRRAALALAS